MPWLTNSKSSAEAMGQNQDTSSPAKDIEFGTSTRTKHTKETDSETCTDTRTGDLVPAALTNSFRISPASSKMGCCGNGCFQYRGWLLASLIVFLGGASCAAFLALGISEEIKTNELHFQQDAVDMANLIKKSWHDYELFAHWAHESCSRLPSSRNESEQSLNEKLMVCNHLEFRNLYEQIQSFGHVGLYSLQYVARVDHEHRAAVEEDLAEYLAENAPYVNFTGFPIYPDLSVQKVNPFYYPILHAEPLEGNAAVLGLDTYEGDRGRALIDGVLSSWKPLLSPPMKLAQDPDPNVFSVYVVHPGAKTSVLDCDRPQAVTSAVIRIPDLLEEAAKEAHHNLAVYLYDSTESQEDPHFMGAVKIDTASTCTKCQTISKSSYSEVVSVQPVHFETEMTIVGRTWMVLVAPLDDSHKPTLTFILLGGALLFVASALLAWVFRSYLQRIVAIGRIRAQSEKEKATMALDQVQRERHLNTYLAHEIRNPLASAMGALSFVSTNTRDLVRDEETRNVILDDANVVDSSLSYINDLLRSMLDMSKAANGQLKINEEVTDVMTDILKPSAAILCMRGAQVKVLTEGPQDLVVFADRLRLKQICLNLSINASKFVERGFIRLRSEVYEGNVRVFIEDSGPGVPPEKKSNLFSEFQESLDHLHQGTGIGLFICHKLTSLMGAKIWLDDSYDSGVPGCPGARFVVDLQRSPLEDIDSLLEDNKLSLNAPIPDVILPTTTNQIVKPPISSVTETVPCQGSTQLLPAELPASLKVLFVDDEAILRKLFLRSLKRVAPTWTVEEAGNADTALKRLTETNFDLVFIDQYMPCIDHPMLGTEAVRQARSTGVACTIVGLSANDMEKGFIEAGADGFMMKPFPCEKSRLEKALLCLIQSHKEAESRHRGSNSGTENTRGTDVSSSSSDSAIATSRQRKKV